MTPVALIATINATAGSGRELGTLLADYAQHVLAMDGAERFEVYEDTSDPDVFIVIERYRDHDAFKLHLDDPANTELNSKLQNLSAGGSSLQFISQLPH